MGKKRRYIDNNGYSDSDVLYNIYSNISDNDKQEPYHAGSLPEVTIKAPKVNLPSYSRDSKGFKSQRDKFTNAVLSGAININDVPVEKGYRRAVQADVQTADLMSRAWENHPAARNFMLGAASAVGAGAAETALGLSATGGALNNAWNNTIKPIGKRVFNTLDPFYHGKIAAGLSADAAAGNTLSTALPTLGSRIAHGVAATGLAGLDGYYISMIPEDIKNRNYGQALLDGLGAVPYINETVNTVNKLKRVANVDKVKDVPKSIKNSPKYQKYIKKAKVKSSPTTNTSSATATNTSSATATNNIQNLPTHDDLRGEIDNWNQANLERTTAEMRRHTNIGDYNDVSRIINEDFNRKLEASAELAREAIKVQFGQPRTMSDTEYLRRINEARDLYQTYRTNPESFQVPVRETPRPVQSPRPSLSEVPNASQPTQQRVVHTVDAVPESSPIAKKYTLEELEKIRQEALDAEDVFELAIDDDVLPIKELRKLDNDFSLKRRTFEHAAKSYLKDITDNVDITKPLNEAIDLNSVPDYLLDNLKQILSFKSGEVGSINYLDFNDNLGKLIENRKTLPSGYKTLGKTNHPNFTSQEGVTSIKQALKYYTDEASNPRNFGNFTEQFNDNFSLQAKPMITASLTELSKARKASGGLPVKVQFTRHGRTAGNRLADLIIQDSNGMPIRYGTTRKNGPIEVGTVLKSNIRRELELYKEFGNQLGIDRSTIDNLSTKFKSGEMSVDDFAKIKTKDGHYMFTTFDKKRKVPRYPSLRFDFKLGGSLNNRHSLKHGGILIQPSHRGRFTALKERTGRSTSWYKEHGTPAEKKMAIFADNAKHWNH